MPKPTSISQKVTFGLLAAVILVNGVLIGAVYVWQMSRVHRLADDSARILAELTASMSQPLWEYDHQQIERIARVIYGHEAISGIEVTDERGGIVFAEGDVEAGAEQRRQVLRYNDHDLGEVLLTFSDAPLQRELSRLRTLTGLTLAGSVIIIVFATRLLVRRTLSRPLKRLEEDLSKVAAGNYEATGRLQEREFKGIVQHYDAMAKAVREREQALRISEQNYRQIFNASTAMIFVQDVQTGAILDVNDEVTRILGYSREDVLERSVAQMSVESPEFSDEIVAERIKRTIEEGSQTFEWQARHKDGHTIWVEVSLRHVTIGGKPRILAVSRDISERRQAEDERRALEEQLRQSQKIEAVGQLAGGIAHDFNNLLQVICNGTAMALDTSDLQDETRTDLELVAEASERAADLTSQLLAFSRRQMIQTESVDINQIIHDLLKMIKRVIGAHITINFKPDQGIPSISADRRMIEQVIMNLCVNARDAMSDGGKLEISTAAVTTAQDEFSDLPAGNYVKVSVQDTGQGMDRATVDRIFEPFFTTKQVDRGTGLGMSVVYGIIRQHHGGIEVQSEPGNGTTVHFLLPPSNKVEANTATPKNESDSPRGSETILIAEDQELVRALTVKLLKQAGYQVASAENGNQALELFRNRQDGFDLLLLDVIMPQKGGYDAYREIKDINPKARTIFMSGYNEDSEEARFAVSENVPLLRKPFDRTSLLEIVRRTLDAPVD